MHQLTKKFPSFIAEISFLTTVNLHKFNAYVSIEIYYFNGVIFGKFLRNNQSVNQRLSVYFYFTYVFILTVAKKCLKTTGVRLYFVLLISGSLKSN